MRGLTTKKALACLDCPAPIKRSLTGRCRTCAAKARFADPAQRAIHQRGCKIGAARRVSDPEERERLRQSMLSARAKLPPDYVQRANISRAKRHWCPADYRHINIALHKQGFPVAQRKQMVATQILADAQRIEAEKAAAWAALTPFERQMERVRQGAKLIAKFEPRRPDYDYTLGGVSGGML